MAKKHLKTLTVPRTWPVKRKSSKFTVRPRPGKPFETSIPLALIFKNLLKYCKTMKEVKTILQDKEIIVDGKRRKNPRYPVGFMDVLSIPVSKEHFKLIINKSKKLDLEKITEAESKQKTCKITGKTILKKGKVQLNLYDGRSLIVKKDSYNVGDSILVELPSQKLKEHYKLEKGSNVFLTGGKHTGIHGVVEKVIEDKPFVVVKTKELTFETLKEFVFVTGQHKIAKKKTSEKWTLWEKFG